MKLKVLLMPLILTISVTLMVWFVYPAYTNGVDGVKEKYDQLKAEQEKLGDIKNRSQNTESLLFHLNSLSSEKDILYKYVPEKEEEEEIFDNLNFSAFSLGLSIYAININQPKEETFSKVTENKISAKNLDSGISEEEMIAILPQAQNLGTEVRLVGNYEKIKEFLLAMENLNRHNNFEKVSIGRGVKNEKQEAPNVLMADMVSNFQVLRKAELDMANVKNPVFLEKQLDTEVVSKISEKVKSNNLDLRVDQKGRTNPFTL